MISEALVLDGVARDGCGQLASNNIFYSSLSFFIFLSRCIQAK
jgi:hypothetical protein